MEETRFYKGAYFIDNSDVTLFEFGAHFSYKALYSKLEELKLKREEETKIIKHNNKYEIKHLSNVKFTFSNLFNKESRNMKTLNKTNRTCALSLLNKKAKMIKPIKPTSKERTNSYNIKNNVTTQRNDNSTLKINKVHQKISSSINISHSMHHTARSRNSSFSNNKNMEKANDIVCNEDSSDRKCNNDNSKYILLQSTRNAKTNKHKNYILNIKSEIANQSRNNSVINKKINPRNNSRFINLFNPLKEKQLKLLFLKKRGISNTNRNYRTSFSSSISKEKKKKIEKNTNHSNSSKTIFFHNVSNDFTKSLLQKNKYSISNLKYNANISCCNSSQKNEKKNSLNNNSTLSSSNNINNSNITNSKKNNL